MNSRAPIRQVLIAVLGSAMLLWCALAGTPASAGAAAYVPGEVVVAHGARTELVHLLPFEGVQTAAARLRREPGVRYAVPNYIAHLSGAFLPDDPGRPRAGGWQSMQWNFTAAYGVNAPAAWGNLIAVHRPGGRGVVVAVLDTGVAYRNWRSFHESPDFRGTRFVDPYDFVARNRFPLDREGHGTFVAGEIAETTNNHFGLTGLAYGASIMPLRVLDDGGNGDAATIGRGIRYAADHGAQVINLSLEFTPDVGPKDIPEIMSAIRYASGRGVIVVAAAGNEGVGEIALPARAPTVVSVGATTKDRCLADYSNTGGRLDLVAPGGGDDATLAGDANCHPDRNLPSIYQMTFGDPTRPNQFGYPDGMFGTSMAAPQVAAAAALVIASGVVGHHPTPSAVLKRLEQTAQPLGGTVPNANYGYGLIDVGAATNPAAGVLGSRAARR